MSLNEKAVKQLTRQGCMVEKKAGENITEEDVEIIKSLEATPMYVSMKMLEKLRKVYNS